MKPKVAIPLALAGMLAGAAITIANANGWFAGHLYLFYLCAGGAVALIAIALGGAVIDALKKSKTEAETPRIHIENRLENIGNPVVQVDHGPKLDIPKRTKAQQHDYETAKKTLSQSGPKAVAVLQFVRRHGEQTFGMYPPAQLPDNIGSGELRNILDDLARGGLISRRDIQEPRNPRSVYEISAPMKGILEELLYEDNPFPAPTDLPPARPIIVPKRYGKGIVRDHVGYTGLAVVNDGEPAYDITIPGAPISNGARLAVSSGHTERLTKNDGEAFYPCFIKMALGGSFGSGLFDFMRERGVIALTLPITYRDFENRWFQTDVTLERDVEKPGGLRLGWQQKRIPDPPRP
jgi:hypothetical protein